MARKKRPRTQDTTSLAFVGRTCHPEVWGKFIILVKVVEVERSVRIELWGKEWIDNLNPASVRKRRD
jgi:hypothetical protein